MCRIMPMATCARSWHTPLASRQAASASVCTPVTPGTYCMCEAMPRKIAAAAAAGSAASLRISSATFSSSGPSRVSGVWGTWSETASRTSGVASSSQLSPSATSSPGRRCTSTVAEERTSRCRCRPWMSKAATRVPQ